MRASTSTCRPRPRRAGPLAHRAFTLIELLVVIVIIGVLAGILTGVATKLAYEQRVRVTQNVMRTTTLAIDQFATTDPLRQVYNGKLNRTFGNLPPYQLAGNPAAANSVTWAIEPRLSGGYVFNPPKDLETRLWRDVAGGGINSGAGAISRWVRIDTNDRPNDDIRALAAYLETFTPGALSQVPGRYRVPLVANQAEYVNRFGQAGSSASDLTQRREILGIVDAWGVPLDYYLHVRLEWGVLNLTGTLGMRVVDRVPVLRSRGVGAEEFRTRGKAAPAAGRWDTSKFIYGAAFPQPAAAVDPTTGAYKGTPTNPAAVGNGWARGVANEGYKSGETYGFVPDPDLDSK